MNKICTLQNSLTLSPFFEVLRGQKPTLTIVFIGRALEQVLGFSKAVRL